MLEKTVMPAFETFLKVNDGSCYYTTTAVSAFGWGFIFNIDIIAELCTNI